MAAPMEEVYQRGERLGPEETLQLRVIANMPGSICGVLVLRSLCVTLSLFPLLLPGAWLYHNVLHHPNVCH